MPRIGELSSPHIIKKGETDMKVLLINGSPNEHGCTYRALKEIADVLAEEGVESEIFQIGKKPVAAPAS